MWLLKRSYNNNVYKKSTHQLNLIKSNFLMDSPDDDFIYQIETSNIRTIFVI